MYASGACEVNVAREVHLTALPARTREHRLHRLDQATVRIGNRQFDTAQSAIAQASQKRRPARFAFRVHEIQADELTPAVFPDAVGDHAGLRHYGTVDAHLLEHRVEKKVRIVAGKRGELGEPSSRE